MNLFGQIRFGLIFIILLSLTLFSCVRENGSDVGEQEGAITLNISCSDMTRATDPGSDDFKENLLLTLDIFFYKAFGDDDCFEHDRVIETYNGSATYTKDLEILTKEKFFGTGETGSCYVYVIANGPQTKIDSLMNRNIASVANLKQIVLASPDLGNSEVDPDMGSKLVRQNYFVMDGGATMTYSDGSASVNVKLARSLSKIQLYVHFPDSVIVNGKTYKPSIISVNGIESDEIKAWGKAVFNNGLMRGYVNDSISRHYSPSDEDYYPASGLSYDAKARYIRKDTLSISHKKDSVTYTYYTHSPFYTYPMTWETFRSNLSTRPTTLMLVVDWYTYDDSDGMSAKTTFYTIDVNSSQASGEVYKFKRNTFYKLYVDVNTIGSDTSTEPIEITGECEILDWNHVNQETSVENLRYLTVERNEYEMDNEETLYIPYSTSHTCEVSDITVNQYDVTSRIAKLNTIADATDLLKPGDSGYQDSFEGYNNLGSYVIADRGENNTERPFSVKLTSNRIIVEHKLDNRQSKSDDTFDYVPFEIYVTIRHADNHDYNETIHITQHPELSISPELNSDFVDTTATLDENNTHSGYVYVNGYNYHLGEDDTMFKDTVWAKLDNDGDPEWHKLPHLVTYDSGSPEPFPNMRPLDQLGSVTGIDFSATNSNPNRYKIRAALPTDETDRIIGNPLSSNISLIPVVRNIARYSGGYYGYYYRYVALDSLAWTKKAIYIGTDGLISNTDKRRMAYYRPARKNGELPSSEKVIAPKFMIASSYGVTIRIWDGQYYDYYGKYFYRSYRERAERRCASYQEEGYPAGRWRLPTSAEVEFLVQLSNMHLIPKLFGLPAASYWTATGWVNVGQENTGPTIYESDDEYNTYKWMYVRCVYDTWYWGEDMQLQKTDFQNADGKLVNGYRFTWGDMPK